MTTSRSSAIGKRVAIRDTYLDEAMTEPLLGTIEDVFWRPDWQTFAYVVLFDHDKDRLPPGGEFSLGRLQLLPAA